MSDGSDDTDGNISEYVSAADGSVAAHYDYSPFGETLIASGPQASTFTHRFSTKPWCHATGFCEYQMRKYNPNLGRWSTRDSIKESGGVNLYATCRNSVTEKIDKLGLFSYCDCVEVKSFVMRYKKAGWKYSGWPFGSKTGSNSAYYVQNAKNRMPKKQDCDTAYQIEIEIEPKAGRNAFVDDNDPGNAHDNPCKLRTGEEIKQNFGPPRARFNYYPVVEFKAGGTSKTEWLWETHTNMDGRYGINSVAKFFVMPLPVGTEINIKVEMHSRSDDIDFVPLSGSEDFTITLE